MKKIVSALVLTSLLTSCYPVKVVAPYNESKTYTLANANENLPIREKKMNWYILFGAVPLDRNKTDKLIEDYQLTKVRAEVKTTPLNILLNIVLNGFLPTTIVTNTVIVEGQREEQAK